MNEKRRIVSSALSTDEQLLTPVKGAQQFASTHSRRRMIKAAAVTGAATLVGSRGGLAQEASPAASPAAVSDIIIRSSVPGVPDLYTQRPAEFQSVAQVPGSGGTVTSFHISYGFAAPVPRDENLYWQGLEERLGVTLEPIIAPVGDYQERLAATVAGGDLPDLTLLVLSQAPDHQRVIQQGAWTDLTPYLTGDALQQYPNLAAFPELYWRNVAIDGKIYGVPRPTTIVGATLMFRQDWAETLGMAEPTNAEEFLELMVAFTEGDPDGNGSNDTWGLSGTDGDWSLPFFEGMFRVPNNWRLNDDGSLTSAYETDEYREMVAFARRLYEAGVYHPDASTMNTQQAKQLFAGGLFGAYDDGWGAVSGLQSTTEEVTLGAKVIGLVPVGHDGGEAVTHKGSGIIGFVAIPASSSQERVEEMLRILNYYCAPYGSVEEKFLNHGLEGVHHEVLPGGSLENNDRRSLERGDLANLTETPPFLTSQGDNPEFGVQIQTMLEGLISIGIDDPTLNAFSIASVETAGELSQLVTDRIGAIITGREPLESMDQFIADWRSRGGDEVRQQFEEDLQESITKRPLRGPLLDDRTEQWPRKRAVMARPNQKYVHRGEGTFDS